MMEQQYDRKTALIRVLFVFIFWVIFHVAQWVTGAVSLGQCIFTVITGTPNQSLMQFGDSLGQYINQIIRYTTYNTDERPFPFSDYPKSDLVIEAES